MEQLSHFANQNLFDTASKYAKGYSVQFNRHSLSTNHIFKAPASSSRSSWLCKGKQPYKWPKCYIMAPATTKGVNLWDWAREGRRGGRLQKRKDIWAQSDRVSQALPGVMRREGILNSRKRNMHSLLKKLCYTVYVTMTDIKKWGKWP